MSGSANPPLTTQQAIIQDYQNILQRMPDDAGLANWTTAVNSGALTLSQVENAIIASPEAQTFVVPIVEMYTALGRAPDHDGLAAWVPLYEGGASLTDVAAGFLASPEGEGIYGTKAGPSQNDDANSAFITTAYNEILGRVPDTGGQAYWVAQLSTGTMTPAQVLAALVGSPEAQQRDATGVNSFLVGAGQGTYATTLGLTTTPGQTFTLTTGIDTGAAFIGGDGDDTFNAGEIPNGVVAGSGFIEPGFLPATIPTWTAGDAIDGGGGTNTFNITQTASIVPLVATSVANIQEANLVTAGGVGAASHDNVPNAPLDTTAWSGLTTLNVFDTGFTDLTVASTTAVTLTNSAFSTGKAASLTLLGGSDVSVTVSGVTGTGPIQIGSALAAPTGTVTLTDTANPAWDPNGTGTMGDISVTGGTAVVVTENEVGAVGSGNNIIQGGSVTVKGTSVTTDVTVLQNPAIAPSATVTGVNDGAVTITDAKSSSATDEGSINNVSLVNFTTATISDNALTNLSVAGGSGNIIIDNSGLTTPTNKTLDLTADGQTGGTLDDADIYTTLNIVTAENNSTFANITFGALTALTVAGTEALTLTSTTGLTALKTVTVSDAAGLTGNFSGSTVTAVDTSDTTGDSTVTIDGSKATFTGGAGADNVTTTGLGKAISGGEGINTLTMGATAAATASLTPVFAGLVTGFEQLILTGATNQSVNLAVLGITGNVSTSGGNGLTLHNLDDGGTLALTGAGTAYTIDNLPLTVGANETLNLTLSADASAAGTNFASTGITDANAGTIDITTVDTEATPAGAHNHTVTLLGNKATTITAAGNNGLTLIATDTAATTVDASGITLGGFTYTSGALAGAALVTGSATGTNTIDVSAATKAVNYTGGSGDDVVTSGSGADIIDVGEGNNTVFAGNGANTISAGDGNNAITSGIDTDIITVGNGNNTVNSGAGLDAVDFGTGTDQFVLTANANGNVFATLTGFAAGDSIKFLAGGGTDTFTTAAITAAPGTTFDGYLAAATAGVADRLDWFQFGGNTYVVQDNSAAPAFANGADQVVKLSGLYDLSTATNAATNILTLHA